MFINKITQMMPEIPFIGTRPVFDETQFTCYEAGEIAAQRLISMDGLHKSYQTPAGNVPVLKGIDLQIDRGEFVAVVGKSGSGKSTLTNMITGIDEPTEGTVLVDGVDIHGLSERKMDQWRGNNLGIIFQFFQLIPTLSLLENVILPMDFCDTYDSVKQQKERGMELLEQVDMAHAWHKQPSQVSGGQQQRVAIARALANDPQLIVADEPTGRLDDKTANAVFDLFQSLVDDGKTFIMVTHDNDLAYRATRQIEVHDGVIVADKQDK